MAQFVAYSKSVEVNGETVLSIVAGMGAFKPRAMEVLAKTGIGTPQAGQWYRQQDWLDAFRIIAETIGPNTLFQIGQAIPKSAKFPPQIDNLEAALSAIDVAYHMNHRGGDIGTYAFKKSGPRSARMVCTNPYPCDFDRGIVDAMGARFKPADCKRVRVVHVDSEPCRKKGGESCTYDVAW